MKELIRARSLSYPCVYYPDGRSFVGNKATYYELYRLPNNLAFRLALAPSWTLRSGAKREYITHFNTFLMNIL